MKHYLAFGLLLSLLLTSCSDSNGSVSNKSTKSNKQEECVEPENPYEDESGHDAGFKWGAENGGECDGNSDSFNEGCEEYQIQLEKYNKCMEEKKK